jgi:DNA-binding CsgD family transcriptional regulator
MIDASIANSSLRPQFRGTPQVNRAPTAPRENAVARNAWASSNSSVGSEEHLEAARAFAQAGWDDSAWMVALARLASVTRSERGQLIGIAGPASMAFNLVDLPSQAKLDFLEIKGGSPQVNPRVAAGMRASPLQVVGDADYHAVTPSLRTNVYADFAHKYDIPHGCQTTLVLQPGLLIGLAVLRSEKAGPVGVEETQAFAALVPHVQAAVRTRIEFGNKSLRLMSDGVEAIGAAAFFCDAGGHIQAMTPTAEALALTGALVRVKDRRLHACTRADDGRLQTALGCALRGLADPAESVTQVLLRGIAGGAPTILQITALGGGPGVLDFAPRLMIVVAGSARRRPTVAMIRTAFDLTQAEGMVAMGLVSGLARQAIARERGVSLATVHTHVKRLFLKLGVHREKDLLAAIAALA